MCGYCPYGSYFDPWYWYSFDEEGNMYWDDKGYFPSMTCVTCYMGYYGPTDGMGCLPCPKGSISTTLGATQCTNCTKGTGPNEDASICVRCKAGQYSLYDGFGCEDCGIGAV